MVESFAVGIGGINYYEGKEMTYEIRLTNREPFDLSTLKRGETKQLELIAFDLATTILFITKLSDTSFSVVREFLVSK
jgi:hypothetical protein